MNETEERVYHNVQVQMKGKELIDIFSFCIDVIHFEEDNILWIQISENQSRSIPVANIEYWEIQRVVAK